MQVPVLMVVPAAVGDAKFVGRQVRMLCLRRASLARLVFIDLSCLVGASAARDVTFFPKWVLGGAAWDDRRMEWKDDPEDRIRELERSLTDQASTSELGAPAAPPTPPPTYGAPFSATRPPSYGAPFPPTYGAPFPATPVKSGFRLSWILLAVLVVGAVVLAAGVALFSALISSTPRSSIGSPSSRPSISRGPTSTSPSGGQVSVSGISTNKTIACTNNAVNVSGVSNTIVITGHCASLTVSGIENTITVDAADKIVASGFNNQITYHSGTPTVNNSGESNVVQQG
jgi:hypothetical protein